MITAVAPPHQPQGLRRGNGGSGRGRPADGCLFQPDCRSLQPGGPGAGGGDSGAVRQGSWAWWAASCWTWSRRNGPVPSRKFWTFRAEKPGPSFGLPASWAFWPEAEAGSGAGSPGPLPIILAWPPDPGRYAGRDWRRPNPGQGCGCGRVQNTFVRLYGMEACQALVTEHTELAVAALTPFADAAWLQELAESLTDRRF